MFVSPIYLFHSVTMAVGPRVSEWRKLPMSLSELCIDTTLRCGQAFRWRKIDDEWFGHPSLNPREHVD